MRKLLITAAAGAALLMTTVAAYAATAGTYTHSAGGYSLCVTNNVVQSGATQLVGADLGGLPKKPNSLTSPAGWSASATSAGGAWTIHWTTFGNGVNNGAQLCGFGWKEHGKALTATLPLTVTEMTWNASYFETILSSATRI